MKKSTDTSDSKSFEIDINLTVIQNNLLTTISLLDSNEDPSPQSVDKGRQSLLDTKQEAENHVNNMRAHCDEISKLLFSPLTQSRPIEVEDNLLLLPPQINRRFSASDINRLDYDVESASPCYVPLADEKLSASYSQNSMRVSLEIEAKLNNPRVIIQNKRRPLLNQFSLNYLSPFIPQDFFVIATFGMFLHDVIMYGVKPDARFGATVADLFVGRGLHHSGFDNRSNLNTLLNHLGNDNPTEPTAYWVPVIATFIPLGVSIWFGTLNKKADLDYISITNHRLKLLFNLLRFIAYTATYLRYMTLLASKIKIKKSYDNKLNECNQQAKTYAYVADIADFVCLACDQWEELGGYLPAMQTAQGCLDLLMKTARSPQILQNRFNEFTHTSGLTNLDFSQQNLALWTDETFHKFFTQLSKKNLKLSNLNLSFNHNENINTAKIDTMIAFLYSIKAETFNLSNQNWLNKLYQQDFFKKLNLSTIKNVILQQNNLDDEESQLLARALNNNYTQSINVADNLIASGLPLLNSSPTIQDINLDNNKIEPTSVSTSFTNTLRRVSLNGMQFSANTNLPGIQKIANSLSLQRFSIADSHLSASQLIHIFKENKVSLLAEMNLSGNNLDQFKDPNQYFQELPSALTLLITHVHIDKSVIFGLNLYFKKSPTTRLSVKMNQFSVADFADFLQMLNGTQVRELLISDMKLTDQHIDILTEFLINSPQQFTAIELANNDFTDQSAIPLATQMANTTITYLNVSQNKLTNLFCQQLSTSLSLTELDISQIAANGDGIIALISITSSPLSTLRANQLPVTTRQAETIAKLLIKSPYTLDYLTQATLNQDQKRALHSAESATNIINLSLKDSNLNAESKQIMSRIRMIANPPVIDTETHPSALEYLYRSTPFALANQIDNSSLTQSKSNQGSNLAFASALPVSVFVLYFVNRYRKRNQIEQKPQASICQRGSLFGVKQTIHSASSAEITSPRQSII